MRKPNYGLSVLSGKPQIFNSKFVISSSLHGIILAEAYGVPAIFLNERQEKYLFKYEDWYQSTGRKDFVKANSVGEALKYSTPELPDLKLMQENLLETFPIDLFC